MTNLASSVVEHQCVCWQTLHHWARDSRLGHHASQVVRCRHHRCNCGREVAGRRSVRTGAPPQDPHEASPTCSKV